jgi:hypothetical protein
MTSGLLTNVAFGSESATGVGTPEFEVTQNIESGLIALAAIHPAGSVGGVTASKFSLKIVPSGPVTLTEAVALPLPEPEQALVMLNEAVLLSVAPHVFEVVELITWACVIVFPARVVGA